MEKRLNNAEFYAWWNQLNTTPEMLRLQQADPRVAGMAAGAALALYQLLYTNSADELNELLSLFLERRLPGFPGYEPGGGDGAGMGWIEDNLAGVTLHSPLIELATREYQAGQAQRSDSDLQAGELSMLNERLLDLLPRRASRVKAWTAPTGCTVGGEV